MHRALSVPLAAEFRTRSEIIAASQMMAMNFPTGIYESDEAMVTIINGAPDSGKSLIPTAMRIQIAGEGNVSNVDLAQETWDAGQQDRKLRIHFVSASSLADQMSLIQRADGTFKEKADVRRELKQTMGDIVFIHNTPYPYLDYGDLFIEVVPQTRDYKKDWIRYVEAQVLDERMFGDGGLRDGNAFWQRIDYEDIVDQARHIPQDYLLPNGNHYEAILGR